MWIHNESLYIINYICINSVEKLYSILLLSLTQILSCHSKCIYYTSIRDTYSSVAPVDSLLKHSAYRSYTIHFAHLGMQMKLDSLLLCIIHSLLSGISCLLYTINLIKKKLVGKCIIFRYTLDHNKRTRL